MTMTRKRTSAVASFLVAVALAAPAHAAGSAFRRR